MHLICLFLLQNLLIFCLGFVLLINFITTRTFYSQVVATRMHITYVVVKLAYRHSVPFVVIRGNESFLACSLFVYRAGCS